MEETIPPRWLTWAREIQALAQTGRQYAVNDFQLERYRRLTEIAAEILCSQSGLDFDPLFDSFKAQPGYATPKVDVRSAVFRDGKLLLVEERIDGGWTLPGGWADVGDTPAGAAEREVWEEAGFRVKANRLIGVYDANRLQPLEVFHAFKLVFLCDLIDGEARPSNETSKVVFFGQDEIPPVLSGERTLPRHIVDAFQAYRDSQRPAVFD